MKEIKDQKVEKYLSITKKALDKAIIAPPRDTEMERVAKRYLDMAQRYYKDAKHFFEKNDNVNAFAAVNYAHGWLDAGAALGLFDVGHDSKLFTV